MYSAEKREREIVEGDMATTFPGVVQHLALLETFRKWWPGTWSGLPCLQIEECAAAWLDRQFCLFVSYLYLNPVLTKLVECPDRSLQIINLSLDSNYSPRAWEPTLVRPLLDKDGLDTTGLLIIFVFVSKLIYFAVAKQLHHYLFTNDLFSESQSPYRPNQSLETAPQSHQSHSS